jgi:hypothetical protein
VQVVASSNLAAPTTAKHVGYVTKPAKAGFFICIRSSLELS